MLAVSAPGCKNASVRGAVAAARPAVARWRGAPKSSRPVGALAARYEAPPAPQGSASTRWAGLAVAGVAARQQRRAGSSACVPRRAAAEAVDPAEIPKLASEADDGDEDESRARVAQSMALLDHYSEESHPGHKPGRFAEVGSEFDGMEFDGMRWRMLSPEGGQVAAESNSQALMALSEEDRVLATKFEGEGGLGLCLNRAFQTPDKLRAEARSVLRSLSGELEEGDEERMANSLLNSDKVNVPWNEIQAQVGAEEVGPVEKAALLLYAADVAEEREAVMRNTWSDVEFHSGELGNAELVSRLEQQFAAQLMRTAEVRIKAKRENGKGPAATAEEVPNDEAPAPEERRNDGIFDLVLKDCQDARDLTQQLTPAELTATLNEPRNVGVALDLIGVYLKNYEIDKCDQVLERVVPLCRQKGGTWLIKALDKLCAVRMKQFRAYDALVALKEIEQLVPFRPEEGWEFHDIMYRNFAWCYSSLDEAEKCLEYTRKSVEVKRTNGVPASWFDIWDLGKAHARLGQKTKQREEMKIGFELCTKAGDIHRTAEPSDRIMLAKILSNVGEVAMGVGDSYFLDDQKEDARLWYEKAEGPLRESYELHATALGPMKPLAGWQAGTMAHCMVRMERWSEARDYLALALKVECTKDSTTNGSLIELIDRVMSCYQQLEDLPGLSEHLADLEQGLAGLRLRGWDRRERDVFALLLQRVSTAFLVADNGKGTMIAKALECLREAETNLQIFVGEAARLEDTSTEQEEVELNLGVEEEDEATKIKNKKFGPQVENAGELLGQIRTSIRILEVSQVQPEQKVEEAPGADETLLRNGFQDLGPEPSAGAEGYRETAGESTEHAGGRFGRDGLSSLRDVLNEVGRMR